MIILFVKLLKYIAIIYIVRLVLTHNLFIDHLKISVKLLGLDIEVSSKEKSTTSSKD
ncbi:hypothetical protein [Clostridium oryzae]|uniref:hypothetical protein n=1 Tax=Clostridium oryzae TaxID=1450648 RepID=UPI00147324A6|nr:hypothetical protein [Clostridium oryzae]